MLDMIWNQKQHEADNSSPPPPSTAKATQGNCAVAAGDGVRRQPLQQVATGNLRLEAHVLHLLPDGLEEHTGEVALAKAGQHHGNQLALVLRPVGNLRHQ